MIFLLLIFWFILFKNMYSSSTEQDQSLLEMMKEWMNSSKEAKDAESKATHSKGGEDRQKQRQPTKKVNI